MRQIKVYNFVVQRMTIGQKIREIVEFRGISQAEFARQINLTRQTVIDIFDRNTIQTDLLEKICDVLDYDFWEFFQQKQSRYKQIEEKMMVAESEAIYLKKNNRILIDLVEKGEKQASPLELDTIKKMIQAVNNETVEIILKDGSSIEGIVTLNEKTGSYKNMKYVILGPMKSNTSNHDHIQKSIDADKDMLEVLSDGGMIDLNQIHQIIIKSGIWAGS